MSRVQASSQPSEPGRGPYPLSTRLGLLLQRPWALRGLVLTLGTAALVAMVTMASVSRLNAHPDEWGHVAAARFYTTHWLPVPVGHADLEPTMMPLWARSYLDELDVVYAFAGHFAAVFGEPLYRPLRAFQLVLFLALLIAAVWLAPQQPMLALALGATPQAWYAFSYFNADALPLALALGAGALIVGCRIESGNPRASATCPDSLASRDLAAGEDPDSWSVQSSPTASLSRRRAVLLGLLLGALSVSKANYWIFVPYAFAALALLLLEGQPRQKRGATLRRLGLVAALATSVFALRWGYDEAINGFQRGSRIEAYVEQNADPRFKHSSLHAPDSYPGLYLREKGYGPAALFSRFHWARYTFESFAGLYGYMTIESPRLYYVLFGVLLSVLGLLAVLRTIREGNRAERWVLVLSMLTAVGLVVQSLYRSWTFDLQPQGRYLFPLLPLAVIGLRPAVRRLSLVVVPVALVLLYGLSLWNFVLVGLARIPR